MQEEPVKLPVGKKPNNWLPVSAALLIFVAASIKILFFTDPPVPPGFPENKPQLPAGPDSLPDTNKTTTTVGKDPQP